MLLSPTHSHHYPPHRPTAYLHPTIQPLLPHPSIWIASLSRRPLIHLNSKLTESPLMKCLTHTPLSSTTCTRVKRVAQEWTGLRWWWQEYIWTIMNSRDRDLLTGATDCFLLQSQDITKDLKSTWFNSLKWNHPQLQLCSPMLNVFMAQNINHIFLNTSKLCLALEEETHVDDKSLYLYWKVFILKSIFYKYIYICMGWVLEFNMWTQFWSGLSL